MTFKDFLKEMADAGAEDPNMSAADYMRLKRQREMNPKAFAMKNAKKQDLESRAAAADDSMSPDQKKAEKQEALAARTRMRVAQQQKQHEAQ